MIKAETFITMSNYEVHAIIPYALVCMTRYGAHWDTGRRRRLWDQSFSDAEKKAATRLFNLSHRWTLTTGVPETVKMSVNTFLLWKKLGDFCASI